MKRKIKGSLPSTQTEAGAYSLLFRRRRAKTDWAGIHLSDAFKSNLDFYIRIPAQRLFYLAARKTQMAAAHQAGVSVDSAFVPLGKPQLGPCYTSYPSALAAYASIGLTGFLEYQLRVSENILVTYMQDYLADPADADIIGEKVDPEGYKAVAAMVVRAVQNRLLLEDLSRTPALSSIELYRLFCVSQQNMKFRTLGEIIDSVILYGDILPNWELQSLHSATRWLLLVIAETSAPHFAQLRAVPATQLLPLGLRWVRDVTRALAKFIPVTDRAPKSVDVPQNLAGKIRNCFKQSSDPAPPSCDWISPLDAPQPPAFVDSVKPEEELMLTLAGALLNRPVDSATLPDLDASTQDSLARFMECIQKAGGQQSGYEDMRSDLLEQLLRQTAFTESPIQGSPVEGHEVPLKFGNEKAMSGEIFDRSVELSVDFTAYDELVRESQPVIDAMRNTLYPNVDEIPERERFRANGSLDPGRLAMAGFSSSVFQRYNTREREDRRGRPVVLIACDGSGSLNEQQMDLTRVLACAWLHSTNRGDVQVLAGLYHSGDVRPGVTGPLVEWLYHPRKTPSTSRKDAARTLVSLPESGTGVQSDVLSIAFMLQEAWNLARGKMVYLILITDCQWNRCLNTEKTGEQEVFSFFQNLCAEENPRLHATLVALGQKENSVLEGLVDHIITVPGERLRDYASVAGQIGTFVASMIKERQQRVRR